MALHQTNAPDYWHCTGLLYPTTGTAPDLFTRPLALHQTNAPDHWHCQWSGEFDTVDHKIVLSKLDFNEIIGVSYEWLKSYLSERNQITVIIYWWYNLLLFFNKSWSSTRVCLRSIIVSNIYKWSAKLVFLVQVYTIFSDDSTLSTSSTSEKPL